MTAADASMTHISSKSEAGGETVAFLGPKGSFSFEAAQSHFGSSAALVAFPTIPAVLDAVAMGSTTHALVPLENSTFGSVQQTLDWFVSAAKIGSATHTSNIADTPHVLSSAFDPPLSHNTHALVATPATLSITINAETLLMIHHCLLSTSPHRDTIRRVYSHPQALAQCSKWLDVHLPNAERVSAPSTSHAAITAAAEPGAAAICNAVCAELYKLPILDWNIEDVQGNTTRFIVLSKKSDKPPSGKDNTLVQFTVDHARPGALCDVLVAVKESGINIVKIDSRPSLQRPWHYVFFIELRGHIQEDAVSKAVAFMAKCCSDLCVLGSYTSLRNFE